MNDCFKKSMIVNKEWEIKKLFSNIYQLVICRKNIRDAGQKLLDFFKDYYQVKLIHDLNDLNNPEICLNILPEMLEQAKSRNIKSIWIEHNKLDMKDQIYYGPMKETYISLFLDQCSG